MRILDYPNDLRQLLVPLIEFPIVIYLFTLALLLNCKQVESKFAKI